MKQVLLHVRSGRLEVSDVPEPGYVPGTVLVRTTASLISAGTEKMMMDFASKSLVGKARERHDLVRQVLGKVKRDGLIATARTVVSRLDQPMPLGYSCAGVVEAVRPGAEEFAVGNRVACAGMGYASHAAMVSVPKNLTVPIPAEVSFEDASYVTLGAIALQGLRTAEVRLGDAVAVIGLGLLGQLTVQLLKAGGCRVVGIDIDPERVALARRLGADAAFLRSEDTVAEVSACTGGSGADCVIVTAATKSRDPIELAGQLCRDRGIVSMVGAVPLDVPRKTYYEKELQLRLSRSYGPGRYDPAYEEGGHDYPIGYVRWTERRNMAEFLRLVATGAVTPALLTTHAFAIDDAASAYALVRGKERRPHLGIVLRYPESTAPAPPRLELSRRTQPRSGALGTGFIGAGNFARGVLLPRFRGAAHVRLVGVCTATGISARGTGEKFGFEYCTTDPEQVLGDDRVQAVVIATRHASHAELTARALHAGKAVFVEKPLAIDEAGLDSVIEALRTTGGLLTVGFNRRFSPLVAELRAFFQPGMPLAMQYRINAGAVPATAWLHDPENGGGRIIGELCHFVDLLQCISGELPVSVSGQGIGGPTAGLHDTVAASIRFDGGSIGSIGYFATGDSAFPKERLEVFGGGGIAVLDDFRRLTLTRGGRSRTISRRSQEKGFDQEVGAFVAAARGQSEAPIPLRSLVATTRTTFAIEASLGTGAPVELRP